MPNTRQEPRQASVSASLTHAVLHAANRLGLDRQALLAGCGLQERHLSDPDARVPFSVQEQLWQQLHESLGHPEPGLLLGRNLSAGPFSVLSYLLQSSATLGDALNAALRYQRLGGEGGELQMEEKGDALLLLYRPLHPDHPVTRTRVLAMMTCWVQMTAPLLDESPWCGAHLRHRQPAHVELYHQAFACPLHFDADDYALAIPSSLRDRPLVQANPPLQQLLRQHAETLLARLPSASLSARVVGLLGEQLAHGEPNRAELARTLHLSDRTLQRRLADEGCSYQQLLTDTRRQLAEQHLGSGALPAAEIALLLGYSEPSVFFRAFRQWTGLTPGEYRSRHQGRHDA